MTIVGRLAAEPEVVNTTLGQEIIRYAVGTSHGPRENRQTSWWKVASFTENEKLRETIMGMPKG